MGVSGTPFRIVDIDEEWGRIGPLVQGVDPYDNAGQDLRRCCRENRALCLISEADGALVLSLEPDRYGRGELELFVRLAASWGPGGSIQRNDAHLDAIARGMGAVRIVCYSARPGMRKALGPEWVTRYIAFERAVHGVESRSAG